MHLQRQILVLVCIIPSVLLMSGYTKEYRKYTDWIAALIMKDYIFCHGVIVHVRTKSFRIYAVRVAFGAFRSNSIFMGNRTIKYAVQPPQFDPVSNTFEQNLPFDVAMLRIDVDFPVSLSRPIPNWFQLPWRTHISVYSFGLNQILQYAPGKTNLDFCYGKDIKNTIKESLICIDTPGVSMIRDADMGAPILAGNSNSDPPDAKDQILVTLWSGTYGYNTGTTTNKYVGVNLALFYAWISWIVLEIFPPPTSLPNDRIVFFSPGQINDTNKPYQCRRISNWLDNDNVQQPNPSDYPFCKKWS